MSQPDANALRQLVSDAFGPNARVLASSQIAGDASTRRYLRLQLAGVDVPATAVVMVLADRAIAMSSDELTVFEKPPEELPYLNVHRFLERIGVPIPAIYAEATERGLLLLEDVGDTPLWDVVAEANERTVLDWYRKAIDALVHLQVAGTRQRDDSCLAFQQAFDERLFEWEFEHFIEWGIEKRLGKPPDEQDASRMRRAFAAIAAELDRAPRVLNHRDYHSWNLYIHRGAVRIIDFQDALLAPVPYDLATLLGDRTTTNVVNEAMETQLLTYYREVWAERSENLAGETLAAESFERTYYLCALQKALKVVGRFCYLDLEKGKPEYLRFLPPTTRQIRRVVDKLSMHDLSAVLDRYLPGDDT